MHPGRLIATNQKTPASTVFLIFLLWHSLSRFAFNLGFMHFERFPQLAGNWHGTGSGCSFVNQIAAQNHKDHDQPCYLPELPGERQDANCPGHEDGSHK